MEYRIREPFTTEKFADLKAGDTVRLGEVGPNFGFDGGGIQIDLQQQWIGDFTELGKIEDWR